MNDCLRVAYVGNFGPPHSTENHVARALEANGHDVQRVQENEPGTWGPSFSWMVGDVVLWTRTGWDWPAACGWPHGEAITRQRTMLDVASARGVPTVGFHLDRWWGLNREGQVHDEPFFRADLVVTADGGHDRQWADAGVNHHWMPPAVSRGECAPGRFRRAYASEVAFVGSWRPGYHAEWKHRPHLIEWLERHYRGRVKFWPAPNQPAVRGAALRDLYASVKVLVGDSCLAGDRYTDGQPVARYWSDRIPETLGRGGYLLHPRVEGLDEHFTPGAHLDVWSLDDWSGLAEAIDGALGDDEHRRRVAGAGRAHVLAHHTYERRMEQLVEVMRDRGLL